MAVDFYYVPFCIFINEIYNLHFILWKTIITQNIHQFYLSKIYFIKKKERYSVWKSITQNHTILFRVVTCLRLYLHESVGLLMFSNVQNVIASDQNFSQLSFAFSIYDFLSICQLYYNFKLLINSCINL